MVMIKIRGHWYDISVAWPLIVFLILAMIALFLPVTLRLLALLGH